MKRWREKKLVTMLHKADAPDWVYSLYYERIVYELIAIFCPLWTRRTFNNILTNNIFMRSHIYWIPIPRFLWWPIGVAVMVLTREYKIPVKHGKTGKAPVMYKPQNAMTIRQVTETSRTWNGIWNKETYFAFDLAIIFAHFFASKNFAVNIVAKSAYLKPGR